MARSDIRNSAIDEDDFDEPEDPLEYCSGCHAHVTEEHDDDCQFSDDEDDDGLGEETDGEDNDPDPDASDFQGLMQMDDPTLLDLAARLLHLGSGERITWKARS
jgi:hypothetical protein